MNGRPLTPHFAPKINDLGQQKSVSAELSPTLDSLTADAMIDLVQATLTVSPPMNAQKFFAVYVRVSTKRQDLASQLPDLERWVAAYAEGQPVKWFKDTYTGKTMERPQWKALEADIAAGLVSKVVVWRLDRLGRTASGLTRLFEDLTARRVGLVSLKDGLDLTTPAGRLMGGVLASVAQYETEIRAERTLAGQAAARAKGKRWGGSQKGRLLTVQPEQVEAVRQHKSEGWKVARIARTVGLSRPTVYRLLNAR